MGMGDDDGEATRLRRGGAVKNVEAALPRVGDLVLKYAS